ncbi:LOW QUALITY PROTEIN: solute carrier family 22 member 6-like [Balaenoptera ricei]|uniref:LOW QUALITY PROTEIN: solute carrier family 22 member 6-like n=1 Tax=Balaenoptera ricei TaxID=2746895 RepID=UPI0028BF0D06|nr:LOW QUALITY PROTEIN: solute carrier family 22 member 6-like [Balaenoptera ricei]
MVFNDFLLQVGGISHCQQVQSTLLILPLLLTFLHNTLQNFTAAVPTHHCRPPADTNLSKDGELDAWLPRDRQGRPESCLRFTSPSAGTPFPNDTETSSTGATEPCTHGWIYDNSTFSSTIVTDWDLICTHKTLPQLSQSIIMAGVLVGNLMLGIMADRFFIESALWHSSLGNLDLTLKALRRVAQIKGKQKEGVKLSVELLRMSLQKGLTMSRAWPSTLQLLRSPAIRQLFLCIVPLWFVLLFSFYGLIMGLQSLGINIYLTQVLFTTVDLPFYFLGFLTTKSLGCKHTQMGSLLLSGNFILTCAMIPLRGPSVTTTLANIGSILSPLVGMTSELYPSLPLFIYGAVLVAACPITVLLPETLGLPLPNTLQDLERSPTRHKDYAAPRRFRPREEPLSGPPEPILSSEADLEASGLVEPGS